MCASTEKICRAFVSGAGRTTNKMMKRPPTFATRLGLARRSGPQFLGRDVPFQHSVVWAASSIAYSHSGGATEFAHGLFIK